MTPFRWFVALAAVLALSIALVMQGSVDSGAPPEASQSLTGEWLAEDIQGGGVLDNAQSTVAFDAENKVSGSGGCNRFRGAASVSGESLTFGPLAGTKMACSEALNNQENKFFMALAATRSFRFEGAFLKFLGEGGAELIRFTRKS